MVTKYHCMKMEKWKLFKEKCLDKTDSFFLGNLRNSEKDKGRLNEYGKMVLKSCRFYTRPLSAEEIKLNYDTRLAYDEDNN